MALISNGTTMISGGGLASGVGGKVLQVVQSAYTGTGNYSLNSGSTDGFINLNITPASSSNKVLCIYNVYLGLTQNTAQPYTILKRDSTDIYRGDSSGSRQRVTASNAYTGAPQALHNNSNQFLDSPSTTSQITYKLLVGGCCGRQFYINRAKENNSEYMTTASSFTLMEIAG